MQDSSGTAYSYYLYQPNIVEMLANVSGSSTLTITYTGGYETIPEDIVDATHQVMAAFKTTDVNSPLTLRTTGLHEEIEMPLKVITYYTKQLLNPYCRVVV